MKLKKIDQVDFWAIMFAFSITLSYLLNALFVYLGQSMEGNWIREYGFIAGNLIFAFITGLLMLNSIVRKRFNYKQLLCVIIVLLFYCMCFIISILKFGFAIEIKNYIIKFICFSIPALFAGCCAAKVSAEKKFISIMDKITYYVLPITIFYIFKAVLAGDNFINSRNLGTMTYMDVAYLLMPFMITQIILFCEKTKKKSWFRFIIIMIFWYAILASGTRGAYVCIFVAALGNIFLCVLRKRKIKRAVIVLTSIVLVFLINAFVVEMPGQTAMIRTKIFFDGLSQKELITSQSENAEVSIAVDEMVGAESEESLTNELEEVPVMRNRGTMYKVAVKEFQHSPIKGIGPLGYTIKYKVYPHNAVLELLCELGIVGTIPIITIICVMVAVIFKLGKTNIYLDYLLLFFLAYAVQMNISGSFWECKEILGILGFSAIRIFNNKIE